MPCGRIPCDAGYRPASVYRGNRAGRTAARELELELTVSFEGKVRRIVRLNTQDRITRVPVDMIVRGI